jgi:hypothetical protein
MKRILVIFLLNIIFINISYQLNEEMATSVSKNSGDNKQKLVKCKLCQEMFEFNFNFDELLKSNKILNIKQTFGLIEDNKNESETYFSNDNMEFITKEISMQYFFKGTESQFDEASSNNKQCKTLKVGSDDNCDKLKFEACEKVLSFDAGICVNFKKTFAEIFKSIKSEKFSFNKKGQNNLRTNNIDQALVKNNPDNYDNLENMNIILKKANKIDEEGTNLKFQFNKIPSASFNFKQKNLHPESDNFRNQFENMSLIEVKQERERLPNLMSNSNTETSRTWTPPRPVLLENFQANIGDQLKDISQLAR